MSRGRSHVAATALASAAITFFGCASGVTHRELLKSPSAYERAAASVQSAEAGDGEAVHALVDLLDDRDDGVRMYAIRALDRLTGRMYGYEYYATESQRAAAVERWRSGLRSGEVVLNTSAARRP